MAEELTLNTSNNIKVPITTAHTNKYTDKQPPLVCHFTQSDNYNKSQFNTIDNVPQGIMLILHKENEDRVLLNKYVWPSADDYYDTPVRRILHSYRLNNWNYPTYPSFNYFCGCYHYDGDERIRHIKTCSIETLPITNTSNYLPDNLRQAYTTIFVSIPKEIDDNNRAQIKNAIFFEVTNLIVYLCRKYKIQPLGTYKTTNVPLITCLEEACALNAIPQNRFVDQNNFNNFIIDAYHSEEFYHNLNLLRITVADIISNGSYSTSLSSSEKTSKFNNYISWYNKNGGGLNNTNLSLTGNNSYYYIEDPTTIYSSKLSDDDKEKFTKDTTKKDYADSTYIYELAEKPYDKKNISEEELKIHEHNQNVKKVSLQSWINHNSLNINISNPIIKSPNINFGYYLERYKNMKHPSRKKTVIELKSKWEVFFTKDALLRAVFELYNCLKT